MFHRREQHRLARGRSARGAVLVEFSLVALAFYLLIAGIVTFGSILHGAQASQDVARLAARELALTPLAATSTFDQALGDAGVRARIYDPNLLVIDLDNVPGGVSLDAYVASLPSVNRALRPLMIYDVANVNGAERRLLRVPGALVAAPAAPSGLSVAVPHVVAREGQGTETIEWLAVLEEVRPDRNDPTTGPFSVASGAPERGVVAVRVNIPVQSSAMGSFALQDDPTAPNLDRPNVANDGAVASINAAPGALVGATGPAGFGTYDGPYGLGRVQMMGKVVRPYRRVVTAQAFFRRELFAEQSQ